MHRSLEPEEIAHVFKADIRILVFRVEELIPGQGVDHLIVAPPGTGVDLVPLVDREEDPRQGQVAEFHVELDEELSDLPGIQRIVEILRIIQIGRAVEGREGVDQYLLADRNINAGCEPAEVQLADLQIVSLPAPVLKDILPSPFFDLRQTRPVRVFLIAESDPPREVETQPLSRDKGVELVPVLEEVALSVRLEGRAVRHAHLLGKEIVTQHMLSLKVIHELLEYRLPVRLLVRELDFVQLVQQVRGVLFLCRAWGTGCEGNKQK